MTRYMNPDPNEETVYPKDRHVVEVMNAADGASEVEVMKCLRFLHDERGLRYGTKNGPRHFSWFPTVVQDYFSRKAAREEVANPCGYQEWEERNETKQERGSDEEFNRHCAAFDPTSEA